MKILYGIQATGNGHISRSRELVSALKKLGHDVLVVFSGRSSDQLWDVDVFRPFAVRRGITFSVSQGRINYLATLKNIRLRMLQDDARLFPAGGYDLVITDFEPVTARIARRHGIPSVGIGHQYAFRYPVPIARRDPLALFILRYFAPADYEVGLHWHHFNSPILPPVVPCLCSGKRPVEDAKKILVYLPFEEQPAVEQLLLSLSGRHFYYYTAVPRPLDVGHIHLRPYGREGFLHDLLTCIGVICNAGFELVSEALNLGKKILVRPLAGQLEQLSNARALELLRLGSVMHELDTTIVRQWLTEPGQRPVYYPHVAGMIADWITKGSYADTSGLTEAAWSCVRQTSVAASPQRPSLSAGLRNSADTSLAPLTAHK